MQIEKQKKICGTILYIKSILGLITSVLGLSGGLFFIIGGLTLTKPLPDGSGDALNDAATNCSRGFVGAIGIAIGIITLIASLIITMLSIVYFINSRRLLRENEIVVKRIKRFIALESFGIFLNLIAFIVLIINFNSINLGLIISGIILLLALTIECIYVIIGLRKLLK